MPYKDPIKEKQRSLKRKEYFKEYHRKRYELGFDRPSSSSKYKYVRKSLSELDPRKALGNSGEEIALSILPGSERINHPSDLRWKGKFIEVKTAIKTLMHPSTPEGRSWKKIYRWKFYLKQLREVDLFLIICKDLDKTTEYILLIPDKDLKVKNFTITESHISKYSKYLFSL